jgi:predicted O-methyltransferase YrrM
MAARQAVDGFNQNIVASFYQIRAYIDHWLDKVDHHSIHSPFFFDFYNKVFKERTVPACAPAIENIRGKLLHSPTEIDVVDLGSGRDRNPRRKLSDIVNKSTSPEPYAQLMLRICEYVGARKIIELGTSVGLTSLYLSYSPQSLVYTFEGSHSLANVALTNFEFMERPNIELIEGDIDHVLPEFLQRDTKKIGFVLIDANHLYEPTLKYFNLFMRRFNEKSVMVIDDIHGTPQMHKAWREIVGNQLVYGSIDLFRCGILFFDPALNGQHFRWSL